MKTVRVQSGWHSANGEKRSVERKCRLCNRLVSFGRRPGQKQHSNLCGLHEAWILYGKRGGHKPEHRTIAQPYYAERAEVAWKRLRQRIPTHGLDLNSDEVNHWLVYHFKSVNLFRFFADLVERKSVYFTAGKVAKIHLLTEQQRAKQQSRKAKTRALRKKREPSLDSPYERRHWPLLPGSFETGKRR